MPPLFTPKDGSYGVFEAIKEVSEAMGEFAKEEKVQQSVYEFASEVTGYCVALVEQFHELYLRRKELTCDSFVKVDDHKLTPFLQQEYNKTLCREIH